MEVIHGSRTVRMMPALTGLVAIAALALWLTQRPDKPLKLRIPGTDAVPSTSNNYKGNPVLAGVLTPGSGQPSKLPGAWPRFRGPDLNGIAPVSGLARSWPGGTPPELWSVEVGEGYAGAAVLNGRVYLMDYDREKGEDSLRCLSLADGSEIWRYSYKIAVKRNHGMSRTVPVVTETRVVAIGPKCHVVCCDAKTGQLEWGLDLVHDFGATVPEWYAGQCPLIDNGRLILAPGGPEALLMAVSLEDGSVIWKTPNPKNWKMTHSSIVPFEFAGKRQYIYCAQKGVVGVAAEDGALLWETTDWKISIATIPSPCLLPDGRIFLSGGYNAGSLMLQLKEKEGGIAAETLFRLEPDVFGATQQTPIWFDGHIYGVRPEGDLVCLNPDGTIAWTSGPGIRFGLGSYMLADGLIFALDDSGLLRMAEANPREYRQLGEAKVLEGRESWGPMALAENRLLVRNFSRLACLDVGTR